MASSSVRLIQDQGPDQREDAGLVAQFGDRVHDALELARELGIERGVEVLQGVGWTLVVLHDPDGPRWFRYCAACGEWSPEVYSFLQARTLGCDVCETRQKAGIRRLRVLTALRHAASVRQGRVVGLGQSEAKGR